MRRVTSRPRECPPSGVGPIVILLAILAGCSATAPTTAPSPSLDPQGVVAEVVSYQLVANQPGRLLVALLSADNRWFSFGSVGVTFEYLGERTGTPAPGVLEPDATAHFLPIPGSPEGEGQPPTLTLPADGRGVYAVESITFPRAGYWQLTARHTASAGTFAVQAAFNVLDAPTVVGVGALAPHSDNAVIGDPGVSDASLDSRAAGGEPIPDPALHTRTIADAIDARHPAVVVFSTPVYCISRFCGPVTDVVAELAAQYDDRADFIHVEIYRDFEAGQLNQAAHDWLSTPDGELREPWTFFIGADGRIAASWDTVATRGEIEPLLKALPLLPKVP
jgi:hypothetical protein